MAYFRNGIQLTDQGKALIAKINAGETTLTVNAIGIGDGALQSDPTQMSHELHRANNVIVKIINDSVVTLEIDFSEFSEHIEREWQFREIGVYAEDPDMGEILYAYGNAGDGYDTIPPHGASTYLKRYLRIPIEVANAAEVHIDANESFPSAVANLGLAAAGAGVFAHLDNEIYMLRRIKAGDGVVIQERTSDILVSANIEAGPGIVITKDTATGKLTIGLA